MTADNSTAQNDTTVQDQLYGKFNYYRIDILSGTILIYFKNSSNVIFNSTDYDLDLDI